MFPFRRIRRAKAPVVIAAQQFLYPLMPCPPIAVISRHFPASDGIRLEDARTIAAPMTIIRDIDPQTWSPAYPLIVLSDLHEGLIMEADREYIWQSFGVPVFEYLIGGDGRIVARECEAHDGLHLEPDSAFPLKEDWPGKVTSEACPCGQSGDRLLSLNIVDRDSLLQ
jgi:hypothetical protein